MTTSMKHLNAWSGNCILNRDPEGRDTQNSFVCNIWVEVPGEKNKKMFVGVVAWADLGKLVMNKFSQGSVVHIKGRLHARSWVSQNGEKKTTIEVVADSIVDYALWAQNASKRELPPVMEIDDEILF